MPSARPAPEARLVALVAGDPDTAWRRRQRVLLRWALDGGGGPLLDLGCGRGFTLALLQALGEDEAVGMEPDATALARALRSGVRRLVRGDGLALPFSAGAFRRVIASEVLEHVADDGALLREIRRVLAPGGIVALSVPHVDFPWSYDPVNALRRRLGRPPLRSGPFAGIWTRHRRLYREADLVARVEAAGLEVIARRRLTRATFPFLHLAVYELGRRLADAGFARPARLEPTRAGEPSRLLSAARWVAELFDVGRDEGEAVGSPSVNLALLARRPDARGLRRDVAGC